jgi:xylulokinase
VSIGAVQVGDVMLMYGATMFLISTVAELLRSPTLWSTNGAAAGTRCLAGGMATSGAITSWLGDLFGGRDYAALTELARRSPLAPTAC